MAESAALPWCLDPAATVTLVAHGERETISLADLLDDGIRIAGALDSRGIGPGAKIGLYATTSFGFIRACLGVWASGNVVVTLPPPSRATRAVSGTAGPQVLLDHSIVESDVRGPNDRDALVLDDLMKGSPYSGPAPASGSPAIIQHSSGTTSSAKGVVLSHRAIDAYGHAIRKVLTHETRSLTWLPLNHDLGFIQYLLFPLHKGDNATLMQPAHFLREPLRWIEEMEASGANYTAGPTFSYGLVARRLEEWTGRRFDLSQWRVAGCGGEAIDHRVLERFGRAAAPHGFRMDAFMPGYGLAEATCAIAMGSFVTDSVARSALNSGRAEPATGDEPTTVVTRVGEVIDGNEVRIIDDAGRALPERTLGEIVVRSPYVMEGYVGVDAPTIVDGDGWLKTGDRGYLADGGLYVTGRIKDLIISAGRNFHAEDIERSVGTYQGSSPCIAFAVSPEGEHSREQLVIVAEARPAEPAEMEAIRETIVRTVRGELGILVNEVVFVEPGSLPKTTSGKFQRSVARTRYQQGELAVIRSYRADIPLTAASIATLRLSADLLHENVVALARAFATRGSDRPASSALPICEANATGSAASA